PLCGEECRAGNTRPTGALPASPDGRCHGLRTNAGAAFPPPPYGLTLRDMSWVGHSAIDIARAVRQGEVTAPEVVGAHIEAIADRNRETGAFRVIRERALDEARALQERD